jgi:hypothetical protein
VKSPLGLCAVLLFSLAATGCVYVDGERISGDDWRDEQRLNRKLISQLDIGMTRDAVVDRLGPPSDSEAFARDGREMRVLFYRTQWKHSDGDTSRDETTPLVFEDDVLLGWGSSVYADLRR